MDQFADYRQRVEALAWSPEVERALRELSPRELLIMEMKLGSATEVEIADECKCSTATVARMWRRTQDKLKEHLNAEDEVHRQ